jgi:hypothetical protein
MKRSLSLSAPDPAKRKLPKSGSLPVGASKLPGPSKSAIPGTLPFPGKAHPAPQRKGSAAETAPAHKGSSRDVASTELAPVRSRCLDCLAAPLLQT